VCVHAGLTLHLRMLYGRNDHHKMEAMFKAFGLALRQAAEYDGRISGVLSTKGTLD
jgi:imidazoleglycerol-phosphate dehydratase